MVASAIAPLAGAEEPRMALPPAPRAAHPARPIENSERLDALRDIRRRAQNQEGENAERPSTTPANMRPLMHGPSENALRRMGTTTTESLRRRMSERHEARRAEIDKRRDVDRGTLLTDAAISRVSALVERMFRRFDAAINRLRNLAGRISSRIEKLESDKKDLGRAKELLGVARVEIDAADAVLAAIRANLEDLIREEDPRAAFEVFHESIAEAKEAIRTAHRALVESIIAIRANAGRSTDATATTTEND